MTSAKPPAKRVVKAKAPAKRTLPPSAQARPAPVLRPLRLERDRDVTADLTSYLTTHGWVAGTPGVAGALWRHPDARTPIAVTDEMRLGSFEWQGVVERLSAWAQEPLQVVARAIEYQFIDVTRMRAANDIVIAGSIPLSAGAQMIASAEAMLRAAGTTSVRLRGNISGNFSRLGDDVVSQARMGHTEEGSYVVPVLMPLTPQEELEPSEPTIEGMEELRNPYEPAERRVTRTLAQALTALDAYVVAPAKQVRARDVHGFVEAGGSRELVVAVGRILSEEAVATFEAQFSWAGGVEAPSSAPTRVAVSAQAVELLAQASRLLKDKKLSTPQLLSGPIVELRLPPGDPYGEVVIQTYRAGRECEVRVRLRAAQVDQAHEWMLARRPVLIEGKVSSGRGQPLRIQNATRVLPVDETMLATG